MKVKWEKFPSVLSRGKSFFYTSKTPIGRLWIVWNRHLQSYMLEDENDNKMIIKSISDGKKKAEEVQDFIRRGSNGRKRI